MIGVEMRPQTVGVGAEKIFGVKPSRNSFTGVVMARPSTQPWATASATHEDRLLVFMVLVSSLRINFDRKLNRGRGRLWWWWMMWSKKTGNEISQKSGKVIR